MKMTKVGQVGRIRALGRFFKDREASLFGKLFVLAALFYVVWPADLIPDVPIIGWLDDIGVMGLATAYLSRVLTKYRAEKSGESPIVKA